MGKHGAVWQSSAAPLWQGNVFLPLTDVARTLLPAKPGWCRRDFRLCESGAVRSLPPVPLRRDFLRDWPSLHARAKQPPETDLATGALSADLPTIGPDGVSQEDRRAPAVRPARLWNQRQEANRRSRRPGSPRSRRPPCLPDAGTPRDCRQERHSFHGSFSFAPARRAAFALPPPSRSLSPHAGSAARSRSPAGKETFAPERSRN